MFPISIPHPAPLNKFTVTRRLEWATFAPKSSFNFWWTSCLTISLQMASCLRSTGDRFSERWQALCVFSGQEERSVFLHGLPTSLWRGNPICQLCELTGRVKSRGSGSWLQCLLFSRNIPTLRFIAVNFGMFVGLGKLSEPVVLVLDPSNRIFRKFFQTLYWTLPSSAASSPRKLLCSAWKKVVVTRSYLSILRFSKSSYSSHLPVRNAATRVSRSQLAAHR